MTTTSNAIATSKHFDIRPHTLAMQSREATPDEHNPAVTAQSAASYEDLMRENAKLRAAIRAANGNIERMLGEIDVMVAKLRGVAK